MAVNDSIRVKVGSTPFGPEIVVLFDDDQGWLTVGADGWESPLEDHSEWVELVWPAPPCERCTRPVPPDLVADGCPLCHACLVGEEPRPPAGTVAAALVERGLDSTGTLDALLASVRRAALADVVRAFDRRANTGRGSWARAASYVRGLITRDH